MALVLHHNCLNEQLSPARELGRKRRRLSSVVKQHAPKNRPYIVSIHRRGTFIRPTDDTVRLPVRHPDYRGPLWSETLVGPNDIVLITEAPLGGGAGGSEGKQIGMALAMVALLVVANVAAPAIAGGLGFAGSETVIGITKGILALGEALALAHPEE